MKKIGFVLCIFHLLFISHHTLAEPKYDYAQPCEAIVPDSIVLKNLQAQLDKTPEQREKILSNFWEKIAKQQTPIIETINAGSSRIVYLWRGALHNVRVVGGASNDHEWLSRIPNTDVWFKETITNNNFYGSYSFAVDIPNIDGYLSHYCPHLNPKLKESRSQRVALRQSFKLDPFNPKKLSSKDQSNLRNENIISLSKSPNFIHPNDFLDRQLNIKTVILKSKVLNNERKISIYQSKKIDKTKPYITAIFFDGDYYANVLQVPKVLDILVERGKLPPIQAVFIDPINAAIRPKELTPNLEFSKFFKYEFLPWLDLHIKRDPKQTVLLGSSLGGLSSAYLALENQPHISHVVPLSGSFWWRRDKNDQPNSMSKIIREMSPQIRQRWYISANKYETSLNNNLSILSTSPVVANDLAKKGHDVVFKEYNGGHSYALWQIVLQDALQHFFK